MRTTVDIEEYLLAEAKALAARTRRTLADVVNDALRVALAHRTAPSAPRVTLPTDGGSGLQPGVDLEDKDALAEILGDHRLSDAAG